MKTFLIPVDFSKESIHSCKYAIHLAGNQPTTLHLFHIYNDQIMIPEAGFTEEMDPGTLIDSDLLLVLKEQAARQMDDLKKEVEALVKNTGQDITIKTAVQAGDPRWEITETSEALHPDMVIMGTRGTGKKGFLEGSMAKKIMSRAPVPVLAVPETYSGFRLKNIMFPTHFNNLGSPTLQTVFQLFGHWDFHLHVCHFLLDKKTKEASLLMKSCEEKFEKEQKEGKISFTLEEAADKEQALKTFVDRQHIDMIAFLPDKKHPLKYLFSSHHLRKKDFFKLGLPIVALHE
jgi:nucleotide-binding universal stress UspA family protein